MVAEVDTTPVEHIHIAYSEYRALLKKGHEPNNKRHFQRLLLLGN